MSISQVTTSLGINTDAIESETYGAEPMARISVSLPRNLYRQFRLHAQDQRGLTYARR